MVTFKNVFDVTWKVLLSLLIIAAIAGVVYWFSAQVTQRRYAQRRLGELNKNLAQQNHDVQEALKESEKLLSHLRGKDIDVTTNPIDGVKTYSLTVFAEHEDKQALIARCSPSSTLDVIIRVEEFPRLQDNRAPIRMKFDEGPPIRQLWQRSTNYHALFSPVPRELLNQTARSNKFLFEYPTDNGLKILSFDLAGMHEGLPKLDAACGITEAAQAEERGAKAAARAAAKQAEQDAADQRAADQVAAERAAQKRREYQQFLVSCKQYIGQPSYAWPTDCLGAKTEVERHGTTARRP